MTRTHCFRETVRRWLLLLALGCDALLALSFQHLVETLHPIHITLSRAPTKPPREPTQTTSSGILILCLLRSPRAHVPHGVVRDIARQTQHGPWRGRPMCEGAPIRAYDELRELGDDWRGKRR